MELQKRIDFLSKLLQLTKTKKITWKKKGFGGSYTANIPNYGTITIEVSTSENVQIYVVAKGVTLILYHPDDYELDDREIEDLARLAERLYLYVYNLFPNPDSIVEDFLNLDLDSISENQQ